MGPAEQGVETLALRPVRHPARPQCMHGVLTSCAGVALRSKICTQARKQANGAWHGLRDDLSYSPELIEIVFCRLGPQLHDCQPDQSRNFPGARYLAGGSAWALSQGRLLFTRVLQGVGARGPEIGHGILLGFSIVCVKCLTFAGSRETTGSKPPGPRTMDSETSHRQSRDLLRRSATNWP